MITHLNPVSRSRASADQFLFSKTKTTRPEEKPTSESFPGQERLSGLFPEAKVGKGFIDLSLNHLSSAFLFGAWVLKIDDFPEDTDDDAAADILVGVAGVIKESCDAHQGLWGRLNRDRFGCFFPEKNIPACAAIAEKVQQKVSHMGDHTVSIGIAGYPTTNYTRSQILENAQKALDHASYFGPNSMICFDSVSLNISGDNYYAEGDVLGAIEEFKRALMLDPSNVNVHNSLGVCYGVMGDLEKAREAFETAVWLDAEEYMAVYNMGIVNLFQGDKGKALACFLKADRLGEDIYEIALQAGKLYVEMGRFEKARDYLEKAVRLNPESAAAFRYLGDCFSELNEVDRAVSAYTSAVKLNPNDAASLSGLGCMFDLKGENPEISTTFCLQSIKIAPENGLYRHRLGSLLLRQHRYEEALREFEAARQFGHDSGRWIDEIQSRLSAKAS